MLFMVRPDGFGHNPQTASTNPWQRAGALTSAEVTRQALLEFDRVVDTLVRMGVSPLVADGLGPACPDGVFPNNWVSTHGDGSVVIYPLLAPNRRAERRAALLEALALEHGLQIRQVLDLSPLEQEASYLEGTGSLVLDRRRGLAYAALSPRTHPRAISEFGRRTGYRVLTFATDTGNGRPVYHTNVMLSIGSSVGLVCADAFTRADERRRVMDELQAGGQAMVEITRGQMASFAANCLEVGSRAGPAILISRAGLESLQPDQIRKLERHSRLCPVEVRTIEQVGGGSIRCMLAEIFLPGAESRPQH
jgi:hypothetical protein